MRNGTYDCGLEGLEHLCVALDFFVAFSISGRDLNRNVSVSLRQSIIDLVRKLKNVVLNLGLGLEGGQVNLLDDGLEVTEPVLRLRVSFLLCH